VNYWHLSWCLRSSGCDRECRNRHCPKCQGAAAREWLAERESELLPVGYFHLVFTLPGPIANIAYLVEQAASAVRGDRSTASP
jgi:hypothetical protein